MAAVGVVVGVAADIVEEAKEMGRVLLMVKEERPLLLLFAVPVVVGDTSRIKACPMALAAAAMAVFVLVGGICGC